MRADIEAAEDRVRTFQKRSEGSLSELEQLNQALDIARLASGLDAVRGHLLELDGDLAAAAESYRLAARRTTSPTQQRYLQARAARLG